MRFNAVARNFFVVSGSFALLATAACSEERTYRDLTPAERAGQPGKVVEAIESDPEWKSRDPLRMLHAAAMRVADKPGSYVFIGSDLKNGLQFMCPEVADMPPICHNKLIHAFGWEDYPLTLGYPEAVRLEHEQRKAGTGK